MHLIAAVLFILGLVYVACGPVAARIFASCVLVVLAAVGAFLLYVFLVEISRPAKPQQPSFGAECNARPPHWNCRNGRTG